MLRSFSSICSLFARKRSFKPTLNQAVDDVVDKLFGAEPKKVSAQSPRPVPESPLFVDEKGELVSKSIVEEPIIESKRETGQIIQSKKAVEPKPKTKPDMNEFYGDRHEFVDSQADKVEPQDMGWFQGKVVNLPDQASVPQWVRVADQKPSIQTEFDQNGPLHVPEIKAKLEEEAALNTKVIDVRLKCDHMEYIIICEGLTERHVYSLSDSIRQLVR